MNLMPTKVNDMSDCDECGGTNYNFLGCCSGFECGCCGMPVDITPCPACNSDGKKEPTKDITEDWPFFFGKLDTCSGE